ncbi:ACP S-malonyltransferase [Anaplasma platys]
MYPGQGSQFVGMCREVHDNFAVARAVFEEVDDTLGRRLSEIIFEGPEEVLTDTCNAQLALFTVSMAVTRAIEYVLGRSLSDIASYVAGHSVGEYSAMCAAGVIGLHTAVRLLDVRSRAMGHAAAMSGGGMSALIGGSIADVESVVNAAAALGVCEIANDNCEGQVVVSGESSALEALPALVEGTAIRRVIGLKVSGPFHSSLMGHAYEVLKEHVGDVGLGSPNVGVVYNVSAAEHDDLNSVKDLIALQVVKRVRWRESMEYLLGRGCMEFVEVGPGEVLTRLLRRVSRSVSGVSVCSMESIDALPKFVKAREFC